MRRYLGRWGIALFLVGASIFLTAGSTPVVASLGGDANHGDVWVDNVGQPSGAGHEQDPHLVCVDINLWGSDLDDASGSYTIDGWPPSGDQAQAYSSTWGHDQDTGGTQVL